MADKQNYQGVWILAEQSDGRVQRIGHELLRRGRELADKRGATLSAVILGHRLNQADLEDLIARGADRVIAVEAPELEHFLVEPYARCMLDLIAEMRPEIIIAGATSTGRTLMPYVAVRANAGLTADCTELDIEPESGNLLQTRPAIGGNILATIKTPEHRPQMATVRPRSTKPADRIPGRKGDIVRRAAPAELLSSRIRRVDFTPNPSEHGLQESDVVVTAGRGVKSAENIFVVEDLAKALAAALGASRDVVDRGWLSYPHQVGLSGKTVSPRLYVAVGVSGAIQHLAGMQTSENIVVINSDPEAQIFRVADFGIVGDLFEVVPALAERIRQVKEQESSAGAPRSQAAVKTPEKAPSSARPSDQPPDRPTPPPPPPSDPTVTRRYSRVTPEVIRELAEIVGERFVIFGDVEKLLPYSHDEVPDKSYARMPEVVVRPGSTEEVSHIMKLANRRLIPITPRGAGSGLSGGAVPVFGGIVLLMDRMNRILDLDRPNMMLVVEPGVVTSEINEMLKEYGLFYPGYPMSLETCFIGGNVAENAGGARAIKYGVTGRYVLGLETVTPTGEVVQIGGKLVKNVTGYDLLGLLVGSEGTLGVFTKIILKLIPMPRASVDLLCLFRTAEEAINAVPVVITESGITPAAIEFIDRLAMQASCRYLNETLSCENAGAMLLISLDGPDVATVERDYDVIGEKVLACGAIEVYVADNYTTSERIWRIRRNIAEAFNVAPGFQCNEDLVVPMSEIPKLVMGLQRLAEKYDVRIPAYGHAGDGNIHARISMDGSKGPATWKETLPEILSELYELTVSLGGTLSGEHGIGHKRKKYLSIFVGPEHLELMRAIKRSFDPNHILNPGKIFDL